MALCPGHFLLNVNLNIRWCYNILCWNYFMLCSTSSTCYVFHSEYVRTIPIHLQEVKQNRVFFFSSSFAASKWVCRQKLLGWNWCEYHLERVRTVSAHFTLPTCAGHHMSRSCKTVLFRLPRENTRQWLYTFAMTSANYSFVHLG